MENIKILINMLKSDLDHCKKNIEWANRLQISPQELDIAIIKRLEIYIKTVYFIE